MDDSAISAHFRADQSNDRALLSDSDDKNHRIKLVGSRRTAIRRSGKLVEADELLTRQKGADDCGDLVDATKHGVLQDTVAPKTIDATTARTTTMTTHST